MNSLMSSKLFASISNTAESSISQYGCTILLRKRAISISLAASSETPYPFKYREDFGSGMANNP